jgi:hypothetical protein
MWVPSPVRDLKLLLLQIGHSNFPAAFGSTRCASLLILLIRSQSWNDFPFLK